MKIFWIDQINAFFIFILLLIRSLILLSLFKTTLKYLSSSTAWTAYTNDKSLTFIYTVPADSHISDLIYVTV